MILYLIILLYILKPFVNIWYKHKYSGAYGSIILLFVSDLQ